MKIGNRLVGDDQPTLIIAEIGINHEGSLETAFAMVDAAKSAGAEVIKHQTHVVEDEMSDAAKKVIPGNADVSIYEIMDRCSLGEAEEVALKEYVESKDMLFISTPFSRAAADRLQRMGVVAFKIGSGECNNYPLLKHISAFGKPIILSTGMNDISNIKKAVSIFDEAGIDYALLHTTNLYPTPPHLVRLGALTQMQKEFPGVEVGLSDHTTGNLACFSAVALGANILERHFTDSMARPGPDIVNSMDPSALKELIEGSEEIRLMRGGEKKPAEEEKVTSDFAFSTVVLIADVKKGECLSLDNIWVKRPGTGSILAEHFESVIGRRVNRDMGRGVHLSWEDLCDD